MTTLTVSGRSEILNIVASELPRLLPVGEEPEEDSRGRD